MVVTSTAPPPATTVTVPYFSPVGTVFGKSARVSSGSALAAMSQSRGTRPSRVSRTHPPTKYAE
jgi:hypothetical protein